MAPGAAGRQAGVAKRNAGSYDWRVSDEAALEESLSRPPRAVVEAMAALAGDIVVLGASGKMGPSLARMALRASREAGRRRRVIAVARFGDPAVRVELERHGVETVACDLLDAAAVAELPDAPNVIYMVGRKFGASADQPLTWATNVAAAAIAAVRYRRARIVAFSTGNVYPLTPVNGGGPRETDPVGPVGEYAQSALGRERVLEHFSARHATPMCILRLNYANEPRYGVLRDIADRVLAGDPIDLAMGYVNLIWQTDANAIALRCLALCSVPPLVLNVTGPETVKVRDIAERFGKLMRRPPRFRGRESDTALLSNAAACRARFGEPETSLDRMIELVARWVLDGGRALGRPTHFEEREGRF